MADERVIAIIQARMTSQRLPGKVLATLPAADAPQLTVVDWTARRVASCAGIDEVVIATSDTGSDDALFEHCEGAGLQCFRGSLDDVLDRFHGAALAHDADVVVRVTADCPFVDPSIIGRVLQQHRAAHADYTGTRWPPPAERTFPIGLDTEVVSMSALHTAWEQARAAHEREHVMPYLYETPGRFVVSAIDAGADLGDVRWTVDTPEDLEAARALAQVAGATTATPWTHLLDVWRAHPELAAINGGVAQRTSRTVDPRSAGEMGG